MMTYKTFRGTEVRKGPDWHIGDPISIPAYTQYMEITADGHELEIILNAIYQHVSIPNMITALKQKGYTLTGISKIMSDRLLNSLDETIRQLYAEEC